MQDSNILMGIMGKMGIISRVLIDVEFSKIWNFNINLNLFMIRKIVENLKFYYESLDY